MKMFKNAVCAHMICVISQKLHPIKKKKEITFLQTEYG